MKINVDRMAVLAGLPRSSSKGRLSENMQHEKHHDDASEAYYSEGDMTYEENASDSDEMADPAMDEIVEIDEVMLVQELRRAKKMMLESKRRKLAESRQESELKKIIEEEVQNIFGEMNLNADWIYGDKRPKRSRQGYTHQGSYLKGIGFK